MLPLIPHPDFPALAVNDVEADAVRSASGQLELRYVLSGAISKLLLPEPAAPARADGLWQHSCLEAFVRLPSSGGYYELNFSPSSEWAAYRLDGYRDGMTSPQLEPPRVEIASTPERLELRASIELPELRDEEPWQLGLSAIVEEEDGRKSYWALAHAPGVPDFHHKDCFALELAAPDKP